MKTDDLYKEKKEIIESFSFNRDVAEVFDDMAKRSIPFYMDLQKITATFSLNFYKQKSKMYDLGCSTGNSIIEICKLFANNNIKSPEIIAVDLSPEMIEIARQKCHNYAVTWICDTVENITYDNASVVLASYVLQFVNPVKRLALIRNIYTGLADNGLFLLSEKVISPFADVESIVTGLYHEYKINNNYSKLEVDQKAIALKNVLVPMTLDDYIDLLVQVGFRKIQIIFKYLQFVCLAAIK